MNKVIRFIIIALLVTCFTASPLTAAHAQGIVVPAPSGTITSTTPTYIWALVTDASQYELQLSQDANIIYTETINASDCGATENCVTTPTTILTPGNYTWQVRAMVNDAWQDYSPATAFTLINPTPATIAPTGTNYTTTPTFTWSIVPGATQYELQLSRDANTIYTETINATDCGSSGNCVTSLSIFLAYYCHTWQVRAMVNDVWQAYSPATTYTLINPIPLPIAPYNALTSTTPTYTWLLVPGATQYELQLSQDATVIHTITVNADVSCALDIIYCSETPSIILPYASGYTWKVRAFIDGEWSDRSEELNFTIFNPYPTLLEPSNAGANNKPTFVWTKIAAASFYQLRITNASGLDYQSYLIYSDECGSDALHCSFIPYSSLPFGDYKWLACAEDDPVCMGDNSKAIPFTIVNPVPTPITPTGQIPDNKPTYIWNKIPGAAQYQYQLYSGTTLLYTQTVATEACGAGVNCVNTPTTVLPIGNYSWKLRTLIAGTWTNFSAAQPFTIFNPIPKIALPGGTINDTTPTYSWGKVTNATQYQYQLFKGTALVYTQTVAASACGTATNCVNTPTKVLPFATYSWKVRSLIGRTWQAFSAPKTFSIVTTPILIAPSSVITDPTPTYSWYRVPGATQYEYQLYKSASLIHAKTLSASTCGASICTATPTATLGVGTYTWKVRAMLAGVWKTFSTVKTFILTPGFHSEFTNNAIGWIPQKGAWLAFGGYYSATGPRYEYVSTAHINKYATFTYEVRLQNTSTPDDHFYNNVLFLRGSPSPLGSHGYWDNGYIFGISHDSYGGDFYIEYIQDGDVPYAFIGRSSAVTPMGAFNTLKVTMNGTFAQFFVNGVRVAYGNKFSLFRTGQVGIGNWPLPGRNFYVDYATLSTSAPASSSSTEGINLDTVSPFTMTIPP